ncbi:mucin-2-like [Procambarus clarkii]|uniref:mucin-2-like n=1 Tax=Procambarus clarkii TaxID=6728 RepID=UPI00374301FB
MSLKPASASRGVAAKDGWPARSWAAWVAWGGVGGLRAGDSATLTCAARANPPAYNFTFLFNGRPLHRANIVESKPTLTLLQLNYRDAGLYTCLASNSEGDGQSNAVALHIDYAPVCEWEGAREVLASVGEKVEMECLIRASPAQVSYTWESVTFTPNMEQIRSPLHHQDSGLTSLGWAVADNSSSGAQRAECQPSNEVGPADRPCVFTILLVDEPSELIGCHYHDVTTDSAGVTCSPGVTSGQLKQTYHIEVREGSTVVAEYNNTEPKFNITSLAPGRDYMLSVFTSHVKARGHPTTLIMKTHTPKAEQVAPERVSVNLNNHGEEPPPLTDDSPVKPGGTPVSVVVSGVVVGVVVGVAVVVAGVVTCRARHAQRNSPGKTHQHHNASRNSLLELPQGALYQSYTRHPSCELLTTFSPGPVVVTQVTSGRSSKRSSPLFRKSSTRSAPGGPSPRGMRPRSSSCRGGPVHVLEVEADDITTPRVEIQSPSRLSRLSLRSEAFKLRDSPSPLSLQCEALQQAESQAELHLVAQGEAQGEAQSASRVHLQSFSASHLRPSSQQRVSPQPYDAVMLQHLHPQVHTIPHTVPQITLTSQAHTASHPDLASSQPLPEDMPHTQLHPSILKRKYSTASLRGDCPGRSSPVSHTGTPPHTPCTLHTTTLPRNLHHTPTLPHKVIQPLAAAAPTPPHTATLTHTATPPHTTTLSHTATPPHTATLPHTATHPHPSTHQHTVSLPHTTTPPYTGPAPYTGTLSPLVTAQVRPAVRSSASQPQPVHPNPHFSQSPAQEPLEPNHSHTTPHLEPPIIQCSSPQSASIKLYPTFR